MLEPSVGIETTGALASPGRVGRSRALPRQMVVMRYFDTLNFADMVRCPTLMGVGLHDEVVPAPTVYGIANHIAGPHEIMEFPVSHSDSPEEQLWEKFETAWLELALNGVSAEFGEGSV